MAIWRMDEAPFTSFDDGQPLLPGADGFGDLRMAAVAKLGTASISYTGTPNWAPPIEENTVDTTANPT